MPTRISFLIAMVFSLVLTACAPPTPGFFHPTLAPTPALESADGFAPGENRTPAGKYPFVELQSRTIGYSRSGECSGASMIDFPTYDFENGRLHLYTGLANVDVNENTSDIIGFFGLEYTNEGAMGGGVNSSLHAIQQLPFAAGTTSIQSILEDGTLALQLPDGQTFWLHPGQVRIEYSESDESNCHIVLVTQLTNFGLLNGENIDLAGTPLAVTMTPMP